MGLKLIEDLFSDEKYLDKLIAAYIAGSPVSQDKLDAFPHIKVLDAPDAVGGIIPWDVVSEDAAFVEPTVAPSSINVNPLSWTITKENISADNNLGAVFFGMNGLEYEKLCTLPGFTGGQVKTMPSIPGVIETEYNAVVTPNLLEQLIASGREIDNEIAAGCYHIIAINLFYENIRKNAIDRKNAFINP